MQQEMHPNESENPCRDIVEYNSGPLWKFLQLPHGRRFDDIEGSKKYKTREKSFPTERDGDQRDQLSGDLVDHDELRIFGRRRPGHASGSGDADQRNQHGQDDGNQGPQRRRYLMGDCGPNHYCGSRSPSARSGAQAADSEESRDQRCPERGARGRPFGKLRTGSRDNQRDAATVLSCARGIGLHGSSSWSSGLRSLIASSASVTGDEITYWPLAHFPRSMMRQRALQKGKSGSVLLTDFLQMGQRSLTVRLRGIRFVLQREDRYRILATRS